MPDHLTYENVFVILAAIIGQTNAHVGTSVTHPWARTPVDLASSFAALAHLAGDRGITVGIGAGSPSSNMIRKTKRVAMARETILFLRDMFAGKTVKLGAFARLAEFFRLDPNAEGFLRLPPMQVPEIFVAAAGPQMLKMAWDIGDGLIVSNLSFPTALVRQGAIDLAMAELEKARRARNDGRKFTKVLHLHISVSRDGPAAKRYAKPMGAGALIQGHMLKQRMLKLPVPEATADRGRRRPWFREGGRRDDGVDQRRSTRHRSARSSPARRPNASMASMKCCAPPNRTASISSTWRHRWGRTGTKPSI